jgi:phosphate transport system substrate-binding protein
MLTRSHITSVVVLVGLASFGCDPRGKEAAPSTTGDGSAPAKSDAGAAAAAGAGKVTIQNRGSDTMLEVAQAWSEAYSKLHPNFSVEVSGGGSGVGIKNIMDGTVDIANSSRLMKDEEVSQAKAKTGKDATLYVVGYDALAVYVHKDNPLQEASIEQLKEIYGENGKITKWSELGVKVPGNDDAIVVVSRQNNSGTYEYFREAVIGKEANFRLGTIDQSGSKDVVAMVASNIHAIGYSGMGYKTPGVKFLKIKGKSGVGILPSIATTHDKTYPIARPLYMYTLGTAAGALNDYIAWTQSDAGQAVLEKVGYVPLKTAERSKGDKALAAPAHAAGAEHN